MPAGEKNVQIQYGTVLNIAWKSSVSTGEYGNPKLGKMPKNTSKR